MLRISIQGNIQSKGDYINLLIGLESSFRGSLPFLLLGERKSYPVSKTQKKPHTSSFPASHPDTSDWPSHSSTTGSHPWMLTVASVAIQQWPCLPHVTQTNDPTWKTWLTTPLVRWVRCVIYSVPKANISLCFSLLIFYLSCQLSPIPINFKLNKYGITKLHSLSFHPSP